MPGIWPQPHSIPDGAIKVTPWGREGQLFTIGRVSARGGMKHLGVLSDAEQVALFRKLGQELARKGLVQTAKAA